jgi:hypothetical protein
MIINLLLNLIILILGAIFSWLPQVITLPVINGYDIDTALSTGISQMYQFMDSFWPLLIMFQGFLVLAGYFLIKMIVRFWIGHRAP